MVVCQSVEFSKLVSLLKPEESEDVILSACQKLTAFFIQRPEQKHVFMSQHGFLPLMELLDVPRNRVNTFLKQYHCFIDLSVTKVLWQMMV